MPRAPGAAMHVAPLDAACAAVAARRQRDVAGPRRQCRENRVEVIDRGRRAADHEAVAAIETPHAAAGTDIDILDYTARQGGRPPDAILVERVAAIHPDVAAFQTAAELRTLSAPKSPGCGKTVEQ